MYYATNYFFLDNLNIEGAAPSRGPDKEEGIRKQSQM